MVRHLTSHTDGAGRSTWVLWLGERLKGKRLIKPVLVAAFAKRPTDAQMERAYRSHAAT